MAAEALAHSICAASDVSAAGGIMQDTTHAATKKCARHGCHMGMCAEHVFSATFRGEAHEICSRCDRDIRVYAEAGSADPWLDLVREDYPALAALLAAPPAPPPLEPARRPRRVLVKFPTRSRPAQFLDVLGRWRSLASGTHEVAYLVTLDEDDPAMNEPGMLAALHGMPGVEAIVGRSASKVEACNRDMEGRVFDVLLLASDDMVPQVPGWDEILVRDMVREFPGFDGALHYPDGYRADIVTLSVMGGNLYGRLGHLYHPSYRSLWCDDEFTAVASALGKLAFCGTLLALHEHPANRGGLGADGLYERNEIPRAADEANFRVRKARRFDMPQAALSVLVATIPERAAMLDRLLASLHAQALALPCPWDVEIRTLRDEGAMTVGAKRNALLAEARGRWSCFVDDDDDVSDDYLARILAALKEDPDCVTFMGSVTHDGAPWMNWRFRRGCPDGQTGDDGVLWRRPNHLCPVRTVLARRFAYPDADFGEDTAWAAAAEPSLTSEAVIDAVLYHYRFSTLGTRTRGPSARRAPPADAPAHEVCASSEMRAVSGGVRQDTRHAAVRRCSRQGCLMGMCDAHTFVRSRSGVPQPVCSMCDRDMQAYVDAGSQDPWLDLVREDDPELLSLRDAAPPEPYLPSVAAAGPATGEMEIARQADGRMTVRFAADARSEALAGDDADGRGK